jgi:molecular chaperone DnaK (HSP70)
MDRLFNRIQSSLRTSGHEEMPVAAVVMIGEGCAMPALQEVAKHRFPTVSIYCDRPLEAVAHGAALYRSPSRIPDRIRNDYTLRYWDPESREHRYRFLVRSGTRYPSAGQVARIIISAAYDGQAYLGIPLCESGGSPDDPSAGIELVADIGGRMRLAGPPPAPGGSSPEPVPVNGEDLTLLEAVPPAKRGEPRFECTFTLDADRNLCVTARDLMTGTMVKTDAPVYRLT